MPTSAPRIDYPKPDGVLTFDRLSSVFISNTNHEENQPPHLHLRDPAKAIAVNWERYRSPEARYCPAGVYEIVGAEEGDAAAADQRAELRALQDLRHQGPDAEHRLGDAGGRRRPELSGRDVGDGPPIGPASDTCASCAERCGLTLRTTLSYAGSGSDGMSGFNWHCIIGRSHCYRNGSADFRQPLDSSCQDHNTTPHPRSDPAARRTPSPSPAPRARRLRDADRGGR